MFCLLPLVSIAEGTAPAPTPTEWELKYLEARNQILQLQAEIFQGAAQKEFNENLKRIEELKKKAEVSR
jgi:hypothetical protein